MRNTSKDGDKTCLIVGAGIAGLSTALALHLAGWRVTVLERRSELPPDGATITLWPNGVRCLAELGIEATTLGVALDGVQVHKLDGRWLGCSPLHVMRKRHGAPVVTVVRKTLLSALSTAIPRSCLRFGVRGTKIVQNDDGIVLQSDDGRRFVASLLVAADGINSDLRSQIVGQACQSYTSIFNWLGNLPARINGVTDTEGIEYLGPDRRLGLMPLRGGGTYFRLSSYCPNGVSGTVAVPEIQKIVESFFPGKRAPTITSFINNLASLKANDIYHSEERDIEPLETWYSKHAVLVGDAAHAMTSGLGQGGNQALEDSLVLARILSGVRNRISKELARFTAERLPRANGLLRQSREKTCLFRPMTPHILAHWYERMDDISSPDSLNEMSRIMDGFKKSMPDYNMEMSLAKVYPSCKLTRKSGV